MRTAGQRCVRQDKTTSGNGCSFVGGVAGACRSAPLRLTLERPARWVRQPGHPAGREANEIARPVGNVLGNATRFAMSARGGNKGLQLATARWIAEHVLLIGGLAPDNRSA